MDENQLFAALASNKALQGMHPSFLSLLSPPGFTCSFLSRAALRQSDCSSSCPTVCLYFKHDYQFPEQISLPKYTKHCFHGNECTACHVFVHPAVRQATGGAGGRRRSATRGGQEREEERSSWRAKKDQDSCCLYRISGESKRLIQLFSTCHSFEEAPDRPLFHAPLSCFPGQKLQSPYSCYSCRRSLSPFERCYPFCLII